MCITMKWDMRISYLGVYNISELLYEDSIFISLCILLPLQLAPLLYL